MSTHGSTEYLYRRTWQCGGCGIMGRYAGSMSSALRRAVLDETYSLKSVNHYTSAAKSGLPFSCYLGQTRALSKRSCL
jgi:hypothetical protein